jgi:hypothetical protein
MCCRGSCVQCKALVLVYTRLACSCCVLCSTLFSVHVLSVFLLGAGSMQWGPQPLCWPVRDVYQCWMAYAPCMVPRGGYCLAAGPLILVRPSCSLGLPEM